MPTNRLIEQTSPYLLQHAHNPVDWHPWGDAALARARREDRPILLSIGYSACHWCHVMERESFEDAATAACMNEHFVCIKVDREERPDLDRIYQTAHQLLTRRAGGWPLTVFLTPDALLPFFAGTYFPDQPRHGMPAFVDVLNSVARFFRTQREQIDAHGRALEDAFAGIERGLSGAVTLDAEVIAAAENQLLAQFDPRHGGFGPAPKFPHPAQLDFCLRRAAVTRTPRLRHAVLYTLERMACGGIFDHLGGGFCRYAVDERWEIPHFEKMLYDNGQLLVSYADAYSASAEPLFRDVAAQTGEWVMREMQSAEGGYYSSLDADSQGEEGRFYAWSRDEVRGLLSDAEYAAASTHWGLDAAANFEGRWHLRIAAPVTEVARALGEPVAATRALLAGARRRLFEQRAQRVRPGLDDKILTSWNGLMIKGMARAGRRATTSSLRPATPQDSSAAVCGSTVGSWPPTGSATATSTHIWTTTSSCWTDCWS